MKKLEIFKNSLSEFQKRTGIKHIFCYEITDSTNIRAKEFHYNGNFRSRENAIFLSLSQKNGRGTHGRSFESPSEAGLYVSFLFYPNIAATDSAKITTYAATRVCRAIERFKSPLSPPPKIKWVNDVYIENKKVSGILTEGSISQTGMLEYAIVGVGINLKSGKLSKELSDIAASLEDFGIDAPLSDIALCLSDEFFSSLEKIGSPEIIKEYREKSFLMGKKITVTEISGEEKVLTVSNIGDNGELICLDAQGKETKYASASITIKGFEA